MANFETFTDGEIPYKRLEQFGLTREMVEDLPQSVFRRLLSSRDTPVLPITTINQDGQAVRSEARISLVRLTDGRVDIALSPKWDTSDLTNFNDSQQRSLLSGKVLLLDIPEKGICFVQYDDTIQQAMTVPVDIIRHNIGLVQQEHGLTDKQVEDIAKGKIIQLSDERGNIASVGVDLRQMSGLRTASGDALAWQEEAKSDNLPEYSFGIYGCWKTDDSGSLSYVKEDDYTPEMFAEQKRIGQQNATGQNMRQMHI